MRTPWLTSSLFVAASMAIVAASVGCDQVFDIQELPATDAGPAPTSTSGNNDGGMTMPTVGLTGLTTSIGPVSPAFDQNTYLYAAMPSVGVLGNTSFTVIPSATPGSDIKIAGTTVLTDTPSQQFQRDLLVANVIDVSVTPKDSFVRHYTLLVPSFQSAYVKASNTAQDYQFGRSVAVSKDGSTLAIGSPGEASFATGINGNQTDTTEKGAGAVFVFTRQALAWKQQAYIKASNTRANAQFGASVALSDNGDTLIVGSSGESSSATGINGNAGDTKAPESGAAYVFARNGTNWSQDAYVKASNTRSNAYFGATVAISGDGSAFAVGSFGESSSQNGNQGDQSASDAGAVYVFQRASGTWVQQSYVKAGQPRSSALFGIALAMSGDGNSIAVGAYGDPSAATGINGSQSDQSASGAGAAYVFVRTGGSWMQQAFVKSAVTRANMVFGYSVALSTDGNTLAVGAYGESGGNRGINGNPMDTSQPYSGAAYVFLRNGSSWKQDAYVKASNTSSDYYFGSAVGLSGDGTILGVGSFGEPSNSGGINGKEDDTSDPSAGAAYVFKKQNGTWSQQTYVKASNAQPGAQFGGALSISADGNMMVVGSYGEHCKSTGINGDQSDYSMPNAGAVYLFP